MIFLKNNDNLGKKIYQGALCVKADNSAIKGNFFSDPGYLQPSIAFSQFGEGNKDHDYNSVAMIVRSDQVEEEQQQQQQGNDNDDNNNFFKNYDNSFKIGNLIPVFYYDNASKTYKDLYGRIFRIPYPSDSGLCNDLNSVGFGKEMINSKCFRKINSSDFLSLKQQCETGFNLQYFTNVYGK